MYLKNIGDCMGSHNGSSTPLDPPLFLAGHIFTNITCNCSLPCFIVTDVYTNCKETLVCSHYYSVCIIAQSSYTVKKRLAILLPQAGCKCN